jgi:hypothetical protein
MMRYAVSDASGRYSASEIPCGPFFRRPARKTVAGIELLSLKRVSMRSAKYYKPRERLDRSAIARP